MRTRSRIGLIIALLALIAIAFTPSVLATKPDDHQVTICHATPPDTAANGWIQITVDIASSGHLQGGHDTQHAADIIPPYVYGDFSFPGLNWTATGREVYDNGCTATPTPTPTGSAPPSSEPTPTPTVTPTPSVVPSPTPTSTSTPRAHATLPPTDTAETKSASNDQPNWLWTIAGLIILGVIGYAVTQAYLSRR